MNALLRGIAATMLVCIPLSGCSGTNGPGNATVVLKDFDPACDADPDCWLPTQYMPKLVSGQTVSLWDEWPAKGDRITVLCQTTGQSFTDGNGYVYNTWYRILVPSDKAVPETHDGQGPEAEPIDGGFAAYVGAKWLDYERDVITLC